MKIFHQQDWIPPDETDIKRKATESQETGRSVDRSLCTYLQIEHSVVSSFSVFLDFFGFNLIKTVLIGAAFKCSLAS